MCTKHKLGNNRGNGEGNYIRSFLFFFLELLKKKLGRWGWPNWRQKLFICGHTNIITRTRRFCSSPGLKRKLVGFKRDVNFSQFKVFFGNCHLSVLLIKSWDRMGVNEKLCCVPQKISGHRKQVPQAEREIYLLTSRKLHELTKQLIPVVVGSWL